MDVARVCVAGMSSGGAGGLARLPPPRSVRRRCGAFRPAADDAAPAAAAISAMEGRQVDAEALADAYWNTHGVLPPALLVLHGDDARVTETQRHLNGAAVGTALRIGWLRASLTAKRATCPPMAMRSAYTRTDLLRDGRIVIRGVRIHGLAHAWSGGDAELPFNDACGPGRIRDDLAVLSGRCGRWSRSSEIVNRPSWTARLLPKSS